MGAFCVVTLTVSDMIAVGAFCVVTLTDSDMQNMTGNTAGVSGCVAQWRPSQTLADMDRR